MKKFILSIFLTVSIFGTLFISGVQAINCTGEVSCRGKEVGDACSAPGSGVFLSCVPANYDDSASGGNVACACVQDADVNEAYLRQWVSINSSDGSSTVSLSGSTGSTYIPPECPNNYEPDFGCINKKIFNPSDPCKENKCVGSAGTEDPLAGKYQDYGIMGIRVRITEESIPSLINLFITTFLGIIALYALIRGIYVAGVKRTQATADDQLAAVKNELTGIIVGFVIAFAFIFIIQIVFNVLLNKSISDINVSFDGSADSNSPQLIISGDGD